MDKDSGAEEKEIAGIRQDEYWGTGFEGLGRRPDGSLPSSHLGLC